MIVKSKLIKVLFDELIHIGVMVNRADRTFLVQTKSRTIAALYLLNYFGFNCKILLDLGGLVMEFKITAKKGELIEHECKFI